MIGWKQKSTWFESEEITERCGLSRQSDEGTLSGKDLGIDKDLEILSFAAYSQEGSLRHRCRGRYRNRIRFQEPRTIGSASRPGRRCGLLTTLPLLKRDGTLQPQQPRRALLLLTGAASPTNCSASQPGRRCGLPTTLPLLTRNGTLPPQQPRRELLLLTGAASPTNRSASRPGRRYGLPTTLPLLRRDGTLPRRGC